MELINWSELVTAGGMPALMLIAFIWYLNKRREAEERNAAELNKSLQETFRQLTAKDSEASKAITDGFKSILQSIVEGQHTIIENQHIQSGNISRLEHKIDLNWSCPLVKDFHRTYQHPSKGEK